MKEFPQFHDGQLVGIISVSQKVYLWIKDELTSDIRQLEIGGVFSHRVNEFIEDNIVLSIEEYEYNEVDDEDLIQNYRLDEIVLTSTKEKMLVQARKLSADKKLKMLLIESSKGASGSILFNGNVVIKKLHKSWVDDVIDRKSENSE